MIPNIHQSIDEIIKSASPAEKVLWQQVRLISGENAAVQQLFYCGTIAAASDFLAYSADKLFLALQLSFSGGTGQVSGSVHYAALNNRADVAWMYMANNNIGYDSTGAVMQYSSCYLSEKNVLFSRISAYGYNYMKFIGYKITG